MAFSNIQLFIATDMGSIAEKTGVARLIELRDQFLLQIEALRNKVDGIEIAIALLKDVPEVQRVDLSKPVPSKRKVLDTVLLLLRESGQARVSAPMAVTKAATMGVTLNPASTSSLLSRLKRDGTVVYENTRYKMREYAKTPDRATSLATPSEPMSANTEGR